MTDMVEHGSMLAACLLELDHVILRTYLADMEGNPSLQLLWPLGMFTFSVLGYSKNLSVEELLYIVSIRVVLFFNFQKNGLNILCLAYTSQFHGAYSNFIKLFRIHCVLQLFCEQIT